MKNTKLSLAFWFSLTALMLSIPGFAQTEDYHCNVICQNQPDYVMAGVQVDLYNANNELVASTFSDDEGFFHFTDLTIGESYTAKFSYDAENTFVDMEDVFQILYYLIGQTQFDEYQQIAANVDGDNNIDIHDFTTVLVDYYLHHHDFPIGNWIMNDWNFTVNGNKDTGGPAVTISSGNVSHDDPDKSFKFVPVDYNETLVVDQSRTISVPIAFNQKSASSGMALFLEFNNELFDVVSVSSTAIEDLYYVVDDNQIRIGWAQAKPVDFAANDAIINVELQQKYLTYTPQVERLSLVEGTQVLDASGHITSNFGLVSSEFKTAVKSSEPTVHAYPNPCTDFFTINLDSETENVTLCLYNAMGQLIRTENTSNNNGQIIVHTETLTKGVYYYQINYQSKSITGPISIR